MKNILGLIFFLILLQFTAQAQNISAKKVPGVDEIQLYLKDDVKSQLAVQGQISSADLASYFRQSFSSRYFYDWQTFATRFEIYNSIYDKASDHEDRAKDHMSKYSDSTQWELPFYYLTGEAVNAYALRHLARQHKMVDIAFQYFYDDKNPEYIDYFVRQVSSLNTALAKEAYESIESGNGVYEVFRSGYRVLNWLTIHNMFLGESHYSDDEQLTTIATLLQHGADLYENNSKFRAGNHQTRGMSALAMLAILFRDFKGTEQWYERAMTRLQEHLTKEINDDGFQSERSVHYHMSDIGNYFYVYQLAKISDMEVSEFWEEKLQSLFVTLSKIAYPDKFAPVLQDDTDEPWAEKNYVAGTMTLGYLLFDDPEFGYFADNRVESWMYWFLSQSQLNSLKSITKETPQSGSLSFETTGYYIMRNGWSKNDEMMIISAGLDDEKPDHQHGDMLGVQAMANGQTILPNYQVRYSLLDYDLFKNSMVKNVALVNNELQGKEWTGNKGGSGFGKFLNLPDPTVITWTSDSLMDLFVGSHNGFDNVGVDYSRQVIFLKDGFWIVKDNFESDITHSYKQVWQGHYTLENGPQLLRSTFSNGAGFDIYQLIAPDHVEQGGSRGKEWSVTVSEQESNHSFITILFPYAQFDKRIDELADNPFFLGWKINVENSNVTTSGKSLTSISRDDETFLFGVSSITLDGIALEFTEETDVHLKLNSDNLIIRAIGANKVGVTIKGKRTNRINNADFKKTTDLRPGDVLYSFEK